MELINLGLGGSALLDAFTARAMRDTPADLISVKIGINLVNTDLMRLHQLHPDAATHRHIGEHFAALAFGTGGRSPPSVPDRRPCVSDRAHHRWIMGIIPGSRRR
ncbi:MAG: hypothetical protein V7646_6872 [Pseudonocardia sp.]